MANYTVALLGNPAVFGISQLILHYIGADLPNDDTAVDFVRY